MIEKHGIQKVDYATDGNAFAGRIICGNCDRAYGRKVWNSTDEGLRRKNIKGVDEVLFHVRKCWASLCFCANYRTVVIDKALTRLAILAEQSPMIKALILEKAPEDWKDIFELLSGFAEGRIFMEHLNLFLMEHGCRTEKTYQPFTSQSWKGNPGRLLVAIRAALQDTDLLKRETKETKRKHEYQKWVESFHNRLKGNWKKLFQWSYEQCRENHILREDTLFELERLFVAGQLITRELGERLTQAGFLSQPGEIVYLTKEEIPEILSFKFDEGMKIQKLIENRRANFSINQTLWKNTLIQTAQKNSGDGLKGQAGSPGLAEGPARIIISVEEFAKLRKGEILVCPYTDPSWTPLFALAAAVVADTGGPLSHAAIVPESTEFLLC